MEKLINILPSLITNEDTNWLDTVTPNPDVLTRDLTKNYNEHLNILAITHASEDYSDLPYPISPKASCREIVAAVNGSELEDKENVAKLFKEVGNKYNTDGLSAFATIWIAAMYNNQNKFGVDENTLLHLFMNAGTELTDDLTIRDVYGEVKSFIDQNKELAEPFADFIACGFMLNPNVQDSEKWFNFSTLEEIETSPDMQITDTKSLFEALKSSRNYISCIDYIKETYLNETDPAQDGYCATQAERDYKAHLIVAKLASELYGKDEEFDKDNTIGYNIVSQVINLQSIMENDSHVLAGLSNHINAVEDAAGRIEDRIMNRSKLTFSARFGDTEKYIENHLRAFTTLANNGAAKYNEAIINLEKLKASLEHSPKKATKSEVEKIQKYAELVDVETTAPDRKLGMEEYNAQVMSELEKTLNGAYKKYYHTKQLIKLIASIKRKKGNSLDIEDVDVREVGKKASLVTPWQEKVVKQYYEAVKNDPVLKRAAPVYRLKSPTIILEGIRERLAEEPTQYPELARLLDTLKQPSKQTKLRDRAEDAYYGDYNEQKQENRDLYATLTDQNATKEEKIDAIEKSGLTREEKDSMNDLV